MTKDFYSEIGDIKDSVGDFKPKPLPTSDYPSNENPLNNPTNPPPYSKSKDEFVPKKTPALSNSEREKYLNEFRGDEVAKNSKIGIVDETKEKPVTLKKYGWMKFFTTLGIIALIIIAGAVALFAYLAYNDGTLLSEPSSLICGNTTLNVEPTTCPSLPAIPSCPTCPKCPEVNVYCNNQTS